MTKVPDTLFLWYNINKGTMGYAGTKKWANEYGNEDLIKHDLKDLVRSSVEEILNALLDKEADKLVKLKNMSVPLNVTDIVPGIIKKLHVTAGEVQLKVPKLKGGAF